MGDFFANFIMYVRKTEFDSLQFWVYPLGTIFSIWLLTVIGLKVFNKRKYLKTVFLIHKAWIIASIVVATIIIGITSYWWSINYFSDNPIQFTLLLSLFIALLVPIISFISLRNYFSKDDLKEIINQPKTQNQLDSSVTLTKQYFKKIKFNYFLLPIGFLLLLLALNKGQNLITIVFDNSGSMQSTNSIGALSDTFDNLEINNEIVLTSLEGLGEGSVGMKNSINEIIGITDYSKLQGGNVVSYSDPISAKSGLNNISTAVAYGSPICEAIWKSFLFIKSTKSNTLYKNKVLIIITDGADNVENTIPTNKFFFDNNEFNDYFPSDKVFIIDYSESSDNPFLEKFTTAGANVISVENQKEQYLDALNNALGSFTNNWYLVIWMAVITAIMTIIALFIEPKKIS
jgi:hypothetical protein